MACTGSATLPPSTRHHATATLRAGGSSPLFSDDVENDIMAPLSVGFDIKSLEHRHYKDAGITWHNQIYIASVEPIALSSTRSRASTSFQQSNASPQQFCAALLPQLNTACLSSSSHGERSRCNAFAMPASLSPVHHAPVRGCRQS